MRLDRTKSAILVKIKPEYKIFLCDDGSMIVRLDKALYGAWKELSCGTCVLWGSGIASCALIDIHGACRHASGSCRVPSCWNLRHSRSIEQGTSVMISTMCYDISDHKFLLVLLSNFTRINSSRTEDKRSQIVNMSLDLLA